MNTLFDPDTLFDPQRAILSETPDPHPFDVHTYQPIAQALAAQRIHPRAPVLTAPVGEALIVLPMLHMVYHHVAQGQLNGTPWLAVFCCLCNGGTTFDPCLGGVAHQFAAQGYYDLMVLVADQQTQSYWNHLTGLCLYGPLAGTTLRRLGPLTQMQAEEVARAYPNALFAIGPDMTAEEQATAERWDARYRIPAEPDMGEGLLATSAPLDERLPRYDMGLGVWTATTQRYYPISALYAQENVIIDRVDARRVVVVVNDHVGLPFAFYFSTDHVEVHGQRVLLGPDAWYQDHTLYVAVQPTTPERPNQAAIRWYAFSSIFPGCEIYRAPIGR